MKTVYMFHEALERAFTRSTAKHDTIRTTQWMKFCLLFILPYSFKHEMISLS